MSLDFYFATVGNQLAGAMRLPAIYSSVRVHCYISGMQYDLG